MPVTLLELKSFPALYDFYTKWASLTRADLEGIRTLGEFFRVKPVSQVVVLEGSGCRLSTLHLVYRLQTSLLGRFAGSTTKRPVGGSGLMQGWGGVHCFVPGISLPECSLSCSQEKELPDWAVARIWCLFGKDGWRG